MKAEDRLEWPTNPTLRIVRPRALEPSSLDERSEARDQDQHAAPLFTSGARDSSVLSKRPPSEIETSAIRQYSATSTSPLPRVATTATTRSVYEPSPGEPFGEDAPPFIHCWAPLPGDLDAQIVEVIRVSPADGRNAQVVFREKEHQLGAIFAALSIRDAQALHRRLIIPAKDDPVASAFGRLTSERRNRLVQFLGDARRRAALERSRR